MPVTVARLQDAFGLQASLTIFLVLLFALLYRRLGREPFFGWWTAAWAAFGAYLLLAASSLGMPDSDVRGAVVLVAGVCGLSFSVFIVAGARALERPELPQRRLVLAGIAGVTVLAMAIHLVSESVPVAPVDRAIIRALPRFLFAAFALGFAATALWPRARSTRSAALLATVCGVWSVEQVLFAMSGARRLAEREGSTALSWLPDVGGILGGSWASIDLLWEAGIAIALVLVLLERHERAGARLDAARVQHQALVEAAPLAIISLDEKAIVRTWNRAAELLLGWNAGDVLGHPLPIIRAETAEANRAFRARVLAGETIIGYETTHRRRDGTDVPVVESASPLRDLEGRIIGHTLVLADLTELRRTEAQLRQAQKMEAVGRLAGGVAHDFNNLLTAVLTTAEVAAGELPDDHPVRADLATITEAGTRAAALTRQLLAFSRQQVLQPEPFDPNALLADLHALLDRVIGADVALVLDLEPLRHQVRADRNQLEQALTNLVVNSRDALPRGGTITLQTRDVRLDRPLQGALGPIPPGDYVSVTVRDDGAGMEQAVVRRAFEPFFTTKEPGRGTGLGLAMVYGFVQQSDGWIDVVSAPGAGTTMTIYLPAHPPADAVQAAGGDEAQPGAAAAAAPVTAGATILIAEDDRLVRELTRTLLAARGYRVLVAENGRAALELAERHAGRIDLLLTDVVMPEIGGPELARRMRERQPGLRVIFMSGYVDEAVVGADALSDAELVQKPFTASVLARRVQAALARDSATG